MRHFFNLFKGRQARPAMRPALEALEARLTPSAVRITGSNGAAGYDVSVSGGASLDVDYQGDNLIFRGQNGTMIDLLVPTSQPGRYLTLTRPEFDIFGAGHSPIQSGRVATPTPSGF
ncbi:MAG: hypothetical protein U0797_16410 [Gemmataceae bacterium]